MFRTYTKDEIITILNPFIGDITLKEELPDRVVFKINYANEDTFKALNGRRVGYFLQNDLLHIYKQSGVYIE